MYTHITFGPAAAGNLRQVIDKNGSLGGDVLVLNDDLSMGRIDDLSSAARVGWWESILTDSKYISAKEHAGVLDDWEKLENIKGVGNDIVVWMAPVAKDELGLLNLCRYLFDFEGQVFLIDAAEEVFVREGWIMSLGQMDGQSIENLWKFKRDFPKGEIAELAKIWPAVSNNSGMFRSRVGKFKFNTLPAEYFDQKILELAGQGEVAAAKIAADLYGQAELEYLYWRIGELIKAGYLQFFGDFTEMGKVKIRAVN